MKRRRQDPNKVREQDMLAALFSVYRRHGREPFRLTTELSYVSLSGAARVGWLRVHRDQAWLTPEGVAALAPYLAEDRRYA